MAKLNAQTLEDASYDLSSATVLTTVETTGMNKIVVSVLWPTKCSSCYSSSFMFLYRHILLLTFVVLFFSVLFLFLPVLLLFVLRPLLPPPRPRRLNFPTCHYPHLPHFLVIILLFLHREIMPLRIWHVPLDVTVAFARVARGERAGICTPWQLDTK